MGEHPLNGIAVLFNQPDFGRMSRRVAKSFPAERAYFDKHPGLHPSPLRASSYRLLRRALGSTTNRIRQPMLDSRRRISTSRSESVIPATRIRPNAQGFIGPERF